MSFRVLTLDLVSWSHGCRLRWAFAYPRPEPAVTAGVCPGVVFVVHGNLVHQPCGTTGTQRRGKLCDGPTPLLKIRFFTGVLLAVQITFKAMGKMLMSVEREDELDVMQKDIGLVCEAMLRLPLRLPWTRFYKGLQARKRFMGALEKMVSERRTRGLEAHDHPHDFLQHLLLMEDDPNSFGANEAIYSLSDAQIKDNILTMIIAGQDTTASAITWMVKYLGENQEVLDVLKAEQLSLAEKSSPNAFLKPEDLNDMPYASKVVKESLRMASIVPWFPRLALQECEIHGYKIKKGWNVNIDARSLHLDPTVYNDPDKFIPSRFDDESKPYSFLAFGQGGRTCLGINLARAMMLVFLHRLVTTYEWKVLDPDSSVEKWALFARLKSGCPVHVTKIREDITPP